MMAPSFETVTFKALSALLCYPDAALRAAVPEIAAALRTEGLLAAEAAAGLQPLLRDLAALDAFEAEARYVELFDRGRRLSLHLFEHVHGESRDRGQAMVDLVAHYERGGLLLAANELPDHLPLFLEFLSTRPLAEARGLLAETAPILALLEERLAKRDSPYAAVFAAVLSLAGDVVVLADTEDTAEPADDLATLDAAWAETAVAFGPGDAIDGCSVDRLKMQMRAARRDARRPAA